MRRFRKRSEPVVVTVTNARHSLSAEIRQRERRYAWSMAIRTACFLGTVVMQGVLRWVLFAAALVMPYFAVVIANTRRKSGHPALGRAIFPMRTQLPPVGHEAPVGLAKVP